MDLIGVPAREQYRAPYRQFLYLKHSDRNIKTLMLRVEELKLMKKDVTTAVSIAARNGEEISSEVIFWLQEVDKISNQTSAILEAYARDSGSWLNVRLRYQLSKSAVVLTRMVRDLCEEATIFLHLDGRMGPISVPNLPSITNVNLPSRDRLVEEAVKALQVNRVVCIHGEAGVGKTELVKKIIQKKMFSHVAWVEISPGPDFIWQAQGDMGDKLGLELKGGTVVERAEELRRGVEELLRGGIVLVVFDNVRNRMDLDAIGLNDSACKMVLVSRNAEAVRKNEKILKVERLPLEEADKLFWAHADHEKIKFDDHLEKQAVKDHFSGEISGGLPRSLVLAAAQSRVPLEQFRKARESYAKLPNDKDKKLFLLCCLFDPDSDIPVETLFRIGLSFGILNSKKFTHELRQEAHDSVAGLKSFSLLCNAAAGKKEYCVKMSIGHNMAMLIGSRRDENELVSKLKRHLVGSLQELEQPRFLDTSCHSNLCQWISSKSIIKQHTSLSFLSLRGLAVGDTDLSFIQQLSQLEILSFAHCDIQALNFLLPDTLKLLDLTECKRLARISPGVLGRLPQLEELYTLGCPVEWEIPGGGERQATNASLGELAESPRLTTLTIRVPSGDHLPRGLLVAAKNLTRFQIYIGDFSCPWDLRFYGFTFTNRVCVCVTSHTQNYGDVTSSNHEAETSTSEIMPAESERVFDLIRL